MRAFLRAHAFAAFYLLSMAIGLGVVAWRHAYAEHYEARTGASFNYLGGIWEGLQRFHDGRIYPNILSVAATAFDEPIYFGVFLFAGAPTIAALIVAWIAFGGAGVRDLFGRLKLWPGRGQRRDALLTYGVLTAAFFALCMGYLGLIAAREGVAAALRPMDIWGLPALLFPLTFLFGGLVDEGATCEELGWRGFALPILLDRLRSPLGASLLLGLLWWFWHFPREVPELITQGVPPTFLAGQLHFIALTVSMSVVMTYCFHRTGGSVIPAILIHGWGNFFTKALPYQEGPSNYDLRLWIFCVVALLIALRAGPDLGRARYLALRDSDAPHELKKAGRASTARPASPADE
ncbi:MAG: CPBP family intramembrane glutamic endopeptidase [Hyphomonadaceae bacterium]|nr:CPBP family intramembrane glutamic endopeptidase [Hyphomonadaceae bacterium]